MSINKHLYSILFIVLILFTGKELSAQVTLNFPEGWIERWVGTLYIYGEKNTKEIYMELKIEKAEEENHWKWTIIYGKGEFGQTRAYELILVDSAKGKYKMDEKNSIILDVSYKNNSFFSTFEVEKNLITAIYTQRDNTIFFEIISCDMKNPLVTGQEGEDISIVSSYPVTVVQRAELKKSN
jgi:hypothetical protein